MGSVHYNQTKKKDYGNKTKFGVAQIVDIILWHWFLVNSTFQLLEFEDKDEKEDNFSIELNLNVKCKGPTPFPQGEPIDFKNPPQT